ncbi:hypothetical protein ACH4KV_29185 [Streptomyces albidoflavus]
MAKTAPPPTPPTTGRRNNPSGDTEPAQKSGLAARAAALRANPGLYGASSLALASGLLDGAPLLALTAGAGTAAATWTALGLRPGPWRWLPGHGDPWEWMARSGRRSYRRTVRRMRHRLAQDHTLPLVVGPDGYLQQLDAVGERWHQHPQRPQLIRAATGDARRARCQTLNAAWTHLLPNWGTGWWRRYSPTEMALRAGPLAAIPATGYLPMPAWAHLIVGSVAAGWGVRMWSLPDPAEPGEPDAEQQTDRADWYRERWAQWIASARGPLPDSRLADVRVDDDRLTAVIVSTTTKAALAVDQDAISIAFEVPPRAVNLYRPQDMPASRAKLTVRLRASTSELDLEDLPTVWKEYSPYHGSELYDVEETEFGRRFKLLMPRRGAGVAEVQARSIAQALDMEGENAAATLHLRALDSRRVEVNEMSRNPLQDGVPVDLEALRMDDKGYIAVGKDIYGNPARWRLLKFDPSRRGLSGAPSASAVHAFGSGTTGAGKTSLEEDLQIAQRLNGFISWLADGKGGAGYAPWFNDLDWLVKSPYGASLMGESGNRVSEHRYAVQMRMQWLDEEGYTETGRSFFVPGEPFAPMAITWDEFNEMVLKNPQADHVKPLLRSVSSVGRLSRAAGVSARIWVQIPNLDSIGQDASANAIRDMLQSGNIALFRTARSDVDIMSLGSRSPEFRLAPLPERFPDGSETGGLFYLADGKAQYTQSRAMFHTNPARLSRQFPLQTLTDAEAAAAGPAYLRREEYRHLDAADEEAFLRELMSEEEGAAPAKNAQVVDLAPRQEAAAADVEDDDLDDLVPPSRSQLVWTAVDSGARRNKQIADATNLKPTNVAGATKRLQRLGKLDQIDRDWHTVEPLDHANA